MSVKFSEIMWLCQEQPADQEQGAAVLEVLAAVRKSLDTMMKTV